jgi:Inositol polyphosphate kinase
MRALRRFFSVQRAVADAAYRVSRSPKNYDGAALGLLFGGAAALGLWKSSCETDPLACADIDSGGSSVRRLPSSASPVAVVGGHSGLMAHDGRVFKPLPRGPRGDMEAGFYLKVNSGARKYQPPATFMPRFHGLIEVEREEHNELQGKDSKSFSSGHRYLELDDLTFPYKRPCVMDIKMGVQAWDEDASIPKIHKEASKYPTQQNVGFRLTGMRVWDKRPALTKKISAAEVAGEEGGNAEAKRIAKLKNAGQDHRNDHVALPAAALPPSSSSEGSPLPPPFVVIPEGYDFHPQGTYREHGRAFGYGLDEKTLEEGFREFLFDGHRVRVELIPSFLERLLEIREWIIKQDEHRFYGSSLLFIYEGEEREGGQRLLPVGVEVRMIDFAHVWPINPRSNATDHDDARKADENATSLDDDDDKVQAMGDQGTGMHTSMATSTTSDNNNRHDDRRIQRRPPPRPLVTSESRDTGYLLGLDSIIRYFLRVMEKHHYSHNHPNSSTAAIDYRNLSEWYRLRWELQDAHALANNEKAVIMMKEHHFHHQTLEQDEAALSYAKEEVKQAVAEARERAKGRDEVEDEQRK